MLRVPRAAFTPCLRGRGLLHRGISRSALYRCDRMNESTSTPTSFQEMGFSPRLCAGLRALGIDSPTPTQSKVIPLVLAGEDVMCTAPTGSGKTLVYLLPIVHAIEQRIMAKQLQNFRKGPGAWESLSRAERRYKAKVQTRRGGPMSQPRALILVPNRELTLQVSAMAAVLAQFTPFRHSFACSGERFAPQRKALATEGHLDLLITTPQRLLQLHEQEGLELGLVEYLVVDEADLLVAATASDAAPDDDSDDDMFTGIASKRTEYTEEEQQLTGFERQRARNRIRKAKYIDKNKSSNYKALKAFYGSGIYAQAPLSRVQKEVAKVVELVDHERLAMRSKSYRKRTTDKKGRPLQGGRGGRGGRGGGREGQGGWRFDYSTEQASVSPLEALRRMRDNLEHRMRSMLMDPQHLQRQCGAEGAEQAPDANALKGLQVVLTAATVGAVKPGAGSLDDALSEHMPEVRRKAIGGVLPLTLKQSFYRVKTGNKRDALMRALAKKSKKKDVEREGEGETANDKAEKTEVEPAAGKKQEKCKDLKDFGYCQDGAHCRYDHSFVGNEDIGAAVTALRGPSSAPQPALPPPPPPLTLIFCNSVSSAVWVHKTVQEAGYDCSCVHGAMDPVTRSVHLLSFAKSASSEAPNSRPALAGAESGAGIGAEAGKEAAGKEEGVGHGGEVVGAAASEDVATVGDGSVVSIKSISNALLSLDRAPRSLVNAAKRAAHSVAPQAQRQATHGHYWPKPLKVKHLDGVPIHALVNPIDGRGKQLMLLAHSGAQRGGKLRKRALREKEKEKEEREREEDERERSGEISAKDSGMRESGEDSGAEGDYSGGDDTDSEDDSIDMDGSVSDSSGLVRYRDPSFKDAAYGGGARGQGAGRDRRRGAGAGEEEHIDTARVLVCTDVLARGIDLPEVEHVILFDFPETVSDYIHRAGRTARSGTEGEVTSIVTPRDMGVYRLIKEGAWSTSSGKRKSRKAKQQTPLARATGRLDN